MEWFISVWDLTFVYEMMINMSLFSNNDDGGDDIAYFEI